MQIRPEFLQELLKNAGINRPYIRGSDVLPLPLSPEVMRRRNGLAVEYFKFQHPVRRVDDETITRPAV